MLRGRHFGIILVFLLIASGGGAAVARDEAGTWEAGAFYDYTHYDVSSEAGNGTGLGLRGGYHFTEKHEVELGFASTSGTTIERVPEIDIDRTSINANYLMNFEPKNREKLDPFLLFGVGHLSLDTGSATLGSITLRSGGGVKWFFTPHLALRFDGAIVYWRDDGTLTSRSTYYAFDAGLGVSVMFGGGAKGAAPEPAGKEGGEPAPEE